MTRLLRGALQPASEAFARLYGARGLTWRFAAAALIIVAAVGWGLTTVLTREISRNARREAERDARNDAVYHVMVKLTRADLAAPMTGARLDEFDRFVRSSVVSDRVVHTKLWNAAGTVIYSDDQSDIGATYPENEDLRLALGGTTNSHIEEPEGNNTGPDSEATKLIEIYTPLTFAGDQQPSGAFELYLDYGPLAAEVARMERYVGLGLAAGLAILYLVLLGIVEEGSRTIRRQNQELQKARETLEQRVEERTQELESARATLERLYERLARQDRARGMLLEKIVGAQEQERHRIALELHDGAIQVLSMLGIRIASGRMLLQRGDIEPATEILRQAEERLNLSAQELRRMMSDLRPPVLDERGVGAAIRDYCDTFQRDTGVAVTVDIDAPPGINNAMETVLFRITQEALTNIRRHASADNAWVSLSQARDAIELLVADDGAGFAVSDGAQLAKGGHFGLLGMQQRAELSGGTWEIQSEPGAGTTVVVRLPLEARAAA